MHRRKATQSRLEEARPTGCSFKILEVWRSVSFKWLCGLREALSDALKVTSNDQLGETRRLVPSMRGKEYHVWRRLPAAG
jgi:hypothetical protein